MKREKNWLSYLGLLGLLGLVGLFTDNTGFYGFFGFFSFWGFSKIIPDERFKANADKAARNSFLLSPLVFTITSIYVTFTRNEMAYAVAFALTFGLQMLTFAFSLQYYERAGMD